MQRAPPDNDPLRIPAPSSEAALHSAQVLAHIRRSIDEAGGWISLADYVSAALYAPGLGYYVAGARKFGADGDFVTAPELSSLFGKALAAQVEEVLAQVPGDVHRARSGQRENGRRRARSARRARCVAAALPDAGSEPRASRAPAPDAATRARRSCSRAWIGSMRCRSAGAACCSPTRCSTPSPRTSWRAPTGSGSSAG